MSVRLPPYREELKFTYAFGRFAVHEALTHRPGDVELVLWHSRLAPAERDGLAHAAAAAGVPAREDDAGVGRLRRKENVYALARVAKRADELDTGADHVLLLRPSHPGNVGTAMRSLAAFGFTDLALVDPAVDAWSPHVVRASVGLRFALRCQGFGSLDDYLERFGERALYRFDAAGERELDEVEFTSPFTLCFGPEWQAGDVGDSLPHGPSTAPTTVRIPQDHQVESLNLAVCVSIVAYRARRIRPH